MTSLALWVDERALAEATCWAEQLQPLLQRHGQSIVVTCLAHALSAKALKQQQALALYCDTAGLWLVGAGMKMQPDWVAQVPRLRRANLKNELLARACQLERAPKILDATAGLGHDALLMAWLGATVTLVERHPILYVLLLSAHAQLVAYAQQHGYARLLNALSNMTIRHACALDVLQATPPASYDVVYLDPMFSRGDKVEQKQPQIKKEMQLLHLLLVADDDLGDDLLTPARQTAPRVVVKRPKLAPPLAQVQADHCWVGDACRFDGYFSMAQPHLVADSTHDASRDVRVLHATIENEG